MQLLVRESLMALMRLNDEIVMTPEMNFSKREKEILKWTAEEDISRDSDDFVNNRLKARLSRFYITDGRLV